MKSRMMRLSAAALLMGAATVTMAPHATSYMSSSAVVNAPILTVRAPFDGRLVEGSAGFATAVRPGATLLRLEAERQDQVALEGVLAEAAATRAEVAALATQIASVSGIETDLHDRIVEHDRTVVGYLTATRRETVAALERTQAERGQIEVEFDRMARLTQTGTTSQAALERLQADLRVATAAVEEAAARRDAMDLAASALGRGIAVDGSSDGGIYARQRLDEVTLQLSGLTARHDTLLGRLAALEAQGTAIGADLVHRRAFEPAAAEAAVVWRAAPTEGTSVSVGDALMELLDCQRRFVEVSLPGRLFERIRPGDPVTILFKGATARFGAHVEAVGGAGARFDHPSLASNAPEIGAGDIQVLVRLDPIDLSNPDVAASFCDVGRTAEVRFSRGSAGAAGRIAAATEALRSGVQSLLHPEAQVSASLASGPSES